MILDKYRSVRWGKGSFCSTCIAYTLGSPDRMWFGLQLQAFVTERGRNILQNALLCMYFRWQRLVVLSQQAPLSGHCLL